MRPIGAFAHLMSSTVQIAPITDRGVYGSPTYGPDVSYRAHIARESNLEDGLVTMVASVWLNTNVSVEPTSRLTLSTADAGSTETYETQPRIVGVERRHDASGAHHTVLRVNFVKRPA